MHKINRTGILYDVQGDYIYAVVSQKKLRKPKNFVIDN